MTSTGNDGANPPPSDESLRAGERTDGLPSRAVFDPLAEEPPSGAPKFCGISDTRVKARPAPETHPAPMVEFWKPSQLRDYEPPANQNLVGDYHIQRGAIAVLAGPPGCGKSRAAVCLAIAGARANGQWLGFDVHCSFRSLILQNENGLARLHRDFEELDVSDDLDEWLRISAPPALGLNITYPQFQAELKAAMRDFAPHLVVVDPWNALARDAMEKDYQEAFDKLRKVLAESAENPACLIIHHLRKPKSDDKHRGRSLAYLMSGSNIIFSVPRSAFILQPATDDVEDNRVVVTTVKNNDGREFGPRTAWERQNGGFLAVEDFDWCEYDKGGWKPREAKVQPEHLRTLFANGELWLDKAAAAKCLQSLAQIGRTAAYDALKLIGGRHSEILRQRDDGKIGIADQ